ncbi:MAG: hypothetical protein N2D54_07345, partial [Chloroflexota bacterium]
AVGKILLYSVAAAFGLGLIPATIAHQKGKRFVDWWFLGAGASLMVIILLFALGAFNGIFPAVT